MEYLFILALIILGIILERSTISSKYSKFMYYFVHFGLIGLAGFRYRVGTDTIRYHEMFDNNIYSNLEFYQPLWNFLNDFIYHSGGEFWGVQLICSIIFFVGLNKHLQRYPNTILIATLIYFYPHFFTKNFELLRESLALGIFFLFGLNFLERKKYIKYYMVAIVCINIHVGSIYLIILPLLLKIRFEKINLFILCNTLFLIFHFINVRQELYSTLQLFELIESKSNSYLINQSNSYNLNYLIKSIFEINLSIVFYKAIKYFLKPNTFIIRFIAIPSILISLGSISFIFPRLINYHLAITIPLIGALFGYFINFKITNPFKLISISILFLLLNISNYYTVFLSEKNGFKTYYKYHPYSSIFNKKKFDKREAEALTFK